MLDKLRENTRSIGTYVIFGILILVFVAYFGPGSSGCQGMGSSASTATYAAKVNGEEIPMREFQSAYANMLRTYQQQMGGNFDEKMAEQLGLKNNVLDGLVTRKLVLDAAVEAGLAVSDAEVAKAVREVPAFQKDGAFDFETYKLTLANGLGVTPDKFEQSLREDLLRQKMIAQVRQAAKATDAEAREEFVKDNDRANLNVVRFAPSAFENKAEVTPAEAQAFLATEDGKKAVEQEFKDKSFKFKQPRRVKAQHILVKVAEDADEATVEAAKNKLLEAKKEIEGGKDFASVASQLSEDPGSKDKGGDLGFFGPGTMAKPFEEAAFALKAGEMSDVVRTRFGFHLIKVNEIQEASEKKLEEVQPQIAADLLKKKKAGDLARAAAESALAQAKAGKSLLELYPAPKEGDKNAAAAIVAEPSGSFDVNSEYVPRVGVSADLAKAAASANAGEALPQVFDVNGTFVVATVAERTRPDMAAFDKDAETYKQRVISRKESTLVESFTKGLREKAKIEKNEALTGGGPITASAEE